MTAMPIQTRSLPDPSPAQLAIIDAWQNYTRPLVVLAVAGSGKSTLLRMLIDAVPESQYRRTVYLAFGKKMADEMRFKLPMGVDCTTIHSQGLRCIKQWMKVNSLTLECAQDDWIDHDKYKSVCRYWTQVYAIDPDMDLAKFMPDADSEEIENVRLELQLLKEEDREEFATAVTQLVHYVMVTLTDIADDDAMLELMEHFAFECPDVLIPFLMVAVRDCIKWGFDGVQVAEDQKMFSLLQSCSGDDMLYWPHFHDMPPQWTYDNLLVDEAQDLSTAQREMVKRIRRRNSKLCAVGDAAQAVFGFAGASNDSLDIIIEEFDAITLPLDVCYRCPEGPINLASRYVPNLLPRPNAPIGEMYYAEAEFACSRMAPGDMVMCRLTSPLISLYYRLLRDRIPAKLLGRDLSTGIVKAIKQIGKFKGFEWEDFPDFLIEYKEAKIKNYEKKRNKEQLTERLNDLCATISALYGAMCDPETPEEDQADSIPEMIKNIERLFSDNPNYCIVLATAHRCKGLEAENVYILSVDLMPFSRSATGWRKVQEFNLLYVALTRCKRRLVFIGDGGYEMANGTHALYTYPLQPGREEAPILDWKAVIKAQQRGEPLPKSPKKTLQKAEPLLRVVSVETVENEQLRLPPAPEEEYDPAWFELDFEDLCVTA